MSADFDFEFELEIDEKDAAAAAFLGDNHRLLVAEILRARKEHGITQKQLADKIGIHKSVISRALKGQNNLTERTISDIFWALGLEPKLIVQRDHCGDSNYSMSEVKASVDIIHLSETAPEIGKTTAVIRNQGAASWR